MITCRSELRVIKSLILSALLIIIFTNTDCTSSNKFVSRNDHSVHTNQTTNKTNFNKMDVSVKIEDLKSWIEKTSKEFDLQSLEEKTIPKNESEMRVWAALKYGAALNCFVIQGGSENRVAYVLTIYADGQGNFKKTTQGKTAVVKRILEEPKSGWKKVDNYLIEKGVQPPLNFVWDEEEGPFSDDESSVILEVKKGDIYSLISYGQLTKTTDGRTVIDICNYLSIEFGVEIGCR